MNRLWPHYFFWVSILIISWVNTPIFAQANLIKNGSFEANGPGPSTLPKHWYNCGDFGYSPPDIHSQKPYFYFFEVEKEAPKGSHFLALVVRDNQTTECVGQELKSPLEAGKAYRISLFLSISDRYESLASTQDLNVRRSFNDPADIEIYGLDKVGNRYLLATFLDINHCIIYSRVSMWMVFSNNISDNSCRFFVRSIVEIFQVIHRI